MAIGNRVRRLRLAISIGCLLLCEQANKRTSPNVFYSMRDSVQLMRADEINGPARSQIAASAWACVPAPKTRNCNTHTSKFSIYIHIHIHIQISAIIVRRRQLQKTFNWLLHSNIQLVLCRREREICFQNKAN